MTKKKRKSKKAKNLIGLRWNSYRAHTRPFVDNITDGYIKSLSQEEKEWLNKFNREYYGTTFSSSKPLIGKTQDDKRAKYREKNRREADVYYAVDTYSPGYHDDDRLSGTDKGRAMLDALSVNCPEDAILELVDLKDSIESKLERFRAISSLTPSAIKNLADYLKSRKDFN